MTSVRPLEIEGYQHEPVPTLFFQAREQASGHLTLLLPDGFVLSISLCVPSPADGSHSHAGACLSQGPSEIEKRGI